MSIDMIKSQFSPIEKVIKAPQPKEPEGIQGDKGPGFGDVLKNAIQEVNGMQAQADNKIEGLMTGKGVTTHEAMIALEKADVAFQLMSQIRGKIIAAYQEVMRTAV